VSGDLGTQAGQFAFMMSLAQPANVGCCAAFSAFSANSCFCEAGINCQLSGFADFTAIMGLKDLCLLLSPGYENVPAPNNPYNAVPNLLPLATPATPWTDPAGNSLAAGAAGVATMFTTCPAMAAFSPSMCPTPAPTAVALPCPVPVPAPGSTYCSTAGEYWYGSQTIVAGCETKVCSADRLFTTSTPTKTAIASEAEAESIVRGWENAWKAKVETLSFEHIDVRYVSSYSFEDAIKSASESQLPLLIGGYILVLGWVMGYSFLSYSAGGSGAIGALTGFAAVLAIMLTTWAAMGVNGLLCSAGLRWNALTFQIVPFLALGLGINDFFVLEQKARLARQHFRGYGVIDVMGEAMAMGGSSVTLSSVANAFAFFLGAISYIPAVRNFSIQVAVTVVCNYLLALTLFPVILSKSLGALRPTSYSVKMEKSGGTHSTEVQSSSGKVLTVDNSVSTTDLNHTHGLGMKIDASLCVTAIAEGGQAVKGGINVGDVITKMGDVNFTSDQTDAEAVAALDAAKGAGVDIVVEFNGGIQSFDHGSLGMQFKKHNGRIYVSQITVLGSAEATEQIRLGDELLQINGWHCVGSRLSDVLRVLKEASGPISMGFATTTAPAANAKDESGEPIEPTQSVFTHLLRYALNDHLIRLAVLVLNLGFVVICAYGIGGLELGLKWTDVLSPDSALYDYAATTQDDFTSSSVYVTYNYGCKEIASDASGTKQYDCSDARLNMDDPTVIEEMRRVEDEYIFKGYSSCSAKTSGRSSIPGENDRSECSSMDSNYGQTSFLRYYTEFVNGNVNSQANGFDATTDVYWYYDRWEARSDLCAGQGLTSTACQAVCDAPTSQAPTGVNEHSNTRAASCSFLNEIDLYEIWQSGDTEAKALGAESYAQLQATNPNRVPILESDAAVAAQHNLMIETMRDIRRLNKIEVTGDDAATGWSRSTQCFCPYRPMLKDFYSHFDRFLSETQQGQISQTFITTEKQPVPDECPTFGKLASSRTLVFVNDLDDITKTLDAIRDGRAVTDASPLNQLPHSTAGQDGVSEARAVFPFDFGVHALTEQYLTVEDALLRALAIATAGVFVVMLPLIVHPLMSLLATLVIVLIEVEVIGLVHFAGMKLNSVTMINCVMAMGIGVEFVAHIGRAAMIDSSEQGLTRSERALQALQEMGPPVVNGAFTTFLSVLCIAGSDYQYFVCHLFFRHVLHHPPRLLLERPGRFASPHLLHCPARIQGRASIRLARQPRRAGGGAGRKVSGAHGVSAPFVCQPMAAHKAAVGRCAGAQTGPWIIAGLDGIELGDRTMSHDLPPP
jgi:hypothetical protein